MKRLTLIAVSLLWIAGALLYLAPVFAWAGDRDQSRITKRIAALGAFDSDAQKAASSIIALSDILKSAGPLSDRRLPWVILVEKAEQLNCGHALYFLNQSGLEISLRASKRPLNALEREISRHIENLSKIFEKICGPEILPARLPGFQHSTEVRSVDFQDVAMPSVSRLCSEKCASWKDVYIEKISSYVLKRFNIKQSLTPIENRGTELQEEIRDVSRFIDKFQNEISTLKDRLNTSAERIRPFVKKELLRAEENLRQATARLAKLELASLKYTKQFQTSSAGLRKHYDSVTEAYKAYLQCIRRWTELPPTAEIARSPPKTQLEDNNPTPDHHQSALSREPHSPPRKEERASASVDAEDTRQDPQDTPAAPKGKSLDVETQPSTQDERGDTITSAIDKDPHGTRFAEPPGPFAFKMLREYFSLISIERMEVPKVTFGTFSDGENVLKAEQDVDIFCGNGGAHNPIRSLQSSVVYWSASVRFCEGDSSKSFGKQSPLGAHQFFMTPAGTIFDVNSAVGATKRNWDYDYEKYAFGGGLGAGIYHLQNVLVVGSLLSEFERIETGQRTLLDYDTIGFSIIDRRTIDINRVSLGGRLAAYWKPFDMPQSFGLEALFVSVQVKLNLDDVSASDRFQTVKLGIVEENDLARLSETELTTSWQIETGGRIKASENVSVSLTGFIGLEDQWTVKRRNGAPSHLEDEETLNYGAMLQIIVRPGLFFDASE